MYVGTLKTDDLSALIPVLGFTTATYKSAPETVENENND